MDRLAGTPSDQGSQHKRTGDKEDQYSFRPFHRYYSCHDGIGCRRTRNDVRVRRFRADFTGLCLRYICNSRHAGRFTRQESRTLWGGGTPVRLTCLIGIADGLGRTKSLQGRRSALYSQCQGTDCGVKRPVVIVSDDCRRTEAHCRHACIRRSRRSWTRPHPISPGRIPILGGCHHKTVACCFFRRRTSNSLCRSQRLLERGIFERLSDWA